MKQHFLKDENKSDSKSPNGLVPSGIHMEFLQMDACNMEFEDCTFQVIVDKGTVDALLSHGGDEDGTYERLHQLFSEVYRVLSPGGSFVLITGNDCTVLSPYVYQQDWQVVVQPLQRANKSSRKQRKGGKDFGKLQMQMLTCTKARPAS